MVWGFKWYPSYYLSASLDGPTLYNKFLGVCRDPPPPAHGLGYVRGGIIKTHIFTLAFSTTNDKVDSTVNNKLTLSEILGIDKHQV